MNRSLKLSMLVALALGGSQAMAMDLGQIQVKSALGQPLLAEIPLHAANQAELQNLTIQLASTEEFARAGIAGGRTAIPLHFSVASIAGGRQVIRITSSVAVEDPYLDLLIEVNGSAGKSVREFAILLDPPGASSSPIESVPQTRVARRTTPVLVKEPRSVAAAPANPAKPVAATGNGHFGPVERGQTLSSIARNTAPAGVDAQQMMLALKQANPDAFYRDNINALKSGAVLRVPTSSEAQAMTIAAAVAEVRRQNGDWRSGTPGKPAVVADTAMRATASSVPSASASDGSDRLALVPAKDGGDAAQGRTAGGKGDKSAALIRQDLMRSQESLASVQQQTVELKTRLQDLTDINSKNEHLLSLKDNQIAELQDKLAAARKSAGLPPAAAATVIGPAATTSVASSANVAAVPSGSLETATTSTSGIASAAPVATSSSGARAAISSSAAPAAATIAPLASAPVVAPAMVTPAAPKPAPISKAAPTLSTPEQPWYMQTWAWGVGVVAVITLLLLAMLGRRRKPVGAPNGKSSSSLADRFGSAHAADGDMLSSDDVDQNELLDQLAEHPDDIGLHLELVTLYYSRRDIERFEAAAEAMHAHITDLEQDEWQDVMHMGEDLVPGHPLFDHHPELPRHEGSEARQEFDIDDYASANETPTNASAMPRLPPAGPKKVSEYNFNFDLTRNAAAAAADHASDAAAAAAIIPGDHASDTFESPASWKGEVADTSSPVDEQGHDLGEFNDDPIDTKLDLARAYLDMGDPDGARAMLGEVMKEGTQMQQDVARKLLESLN